MINVAIFETGPIQTGKSRDLILSGDGPFQLTLSCFVESPPPPGFRPCAACGDFTVNSFESFKINSDQTLWQGKEGSIVIDIVDAVGDTEQLKIKVLPDSRSSSSSAVAK